MSRIRIAECSLYGAAALLLAGTVGLRPGGDGRARTLLTAQAVLDQVAAAERSELAAHGAFKAFGPTDADLRQALPGLRQPPGFLVDALPNVAGGLHMRAVTRPDQLDTLAPVLVTLDLSRP